MLPSCGGPWFRALVAGTGRLKQSGLGREGGHEGMLDYLESKYVDVAVTW